MPRPLPGEEGGEAAAFAVWRGTAPDWRRVVTIAGDGLKLLSETEARTAVRVSGVDRVPQSIEPLLFANANADVVTWSRRRDGVDPNSVRFRKRFFVRTMNVSHQIA